MWRWVPGAAFRAEMARATPAAAGTPRAEKTSEDVAMGVETDDDVRTEILLSLSGGER